MKSEKTWRNNCLLASALCFGLWILVGCTGTVAPKIATSSQPSWDGGYQNSGILAETDAHSLVISSHARDRYNGLIASYGGKYSPALKSDDGVAATGTNTFLLDAGHAAKFIEMNRWRKQGAPPWVTGK